METRHSQIERFLPIQAAAVLAVLALVVVASAQGYSKIANSNRALSAKNGSDAAPSVARTPYGSINWQASPVASTTGAELDADGISNIADNVAGVLVGSYAALSESGSYTQEEGERVAADIASSLKASVSYKTYSSGDLTTDADTSYARMLAYRNDLRIALEPLLQNPGYELSLFANYIESRDNTHLDRLKATAENYRLAIKNAAGVVVPEDALSEHIGILNSLSEFASVVERLTEHADDAFASAALLRTYNESEANLLASFNKLAGYYRGKKS